MKIEQSESGFRGGFNLRKKNGIEIEICRDSFVFRFGEFAPVVAWLHKYSEYKPYITKMFGILHGDGKFRKLFWQTLKEEEK
jgi:hypothetical protein